jgi:hypothetical protein
MLEIFKLKIQTKKLNISNVLGNKRSVFISYWIAKFSYFNCLQHADVFQLFHD